MRNAGLVLAGGASRRFGREKALAVFAGRPMIAAVCDVLRRGCEPVGVNAPSASAAATWAREAGLAVVPDEAAAAGGPLVGVLSGLRWALGQGLDGLVTAPCDLPRLPRDLVARLTAATSRSRGSVAVHGEDVVEPLCALWPAAVLAMLEDALRGERHSAARAIVDALQFKRVGFESSDAFLNVNAVADVARADAKQERADSG